MPLGLLLVVSVLVMVVVGESGEGFVFFVSSSYESQTYCGITVCGRFPSKLLKRTRKHHLGFHSILWSVRLS